VPEPGAADEVERLRAELAQAQHMLREANGKLGEWQALVEEALHTALFNPEANDRYRMHASHMCTAALVALPQVTRVKHVRCSFPSLRREAPTVRLARYTSLESSEWQLSWAPSWSVDVCVEVRAACAPLDGGRARRHPCARRRPRASRRAITTSILSSRCASAECRSLGGFARTSQRRWAPAA